MQTTSRALGYNSDVARMSPQQYLSSQHFWLIEQRNVLLVLGFVVVITLLLARLIWNTSWTALALTSNMINLLLYGLGVYGCMVALKSIAQVGIETMLALEVIRKAKQPRSNELELSKLHETLLPKNPTDPPLAMPRMLDHVCMEAQNLRFDSNVNIVQPFIDESLEHVFELVNLQKLALRGGICATFIGLLLALQQMASSSGNVTSGEGEALGNLLKQLSSALFVAFSGSAVGLQIALTLGLLILILRAKQVTLFREMMEATTMILDLARHARNDGQAEVITELNHIHRGITQLSGNLHNHIQRMEVSLDATRERIDVQTNSIGAGLEQLQQAKISYQGLINNVTTVQNDFITEVRGIYRDLSLDSFRNEIKGGLIEAGKEIAGTLDSTEQAIKAQTSEMSNGMELLSRTSESFARFLGNIETSHQEFLKNMIQTQNASPIMSSNTRLETSVTQLHRSVEILSRSVRDLNTSMNTSLWKRMFGRK